MTDLDVHELSSKLSNDNPISSETIEASFPESSHNLAWDGADDVKNPHNWSDRKKLCITLIISMFRTMSSVASSIMAPALPVLAADLDIPDGVQENMTLSIFLLAFAMGLLLLGPLSEIFGRRPVLLIQIPGSLSVIFSPATAGPNGLGGCSALALGTGTLSDCWDISERGRSMSMYTLTPLLGFALSPIIGGLMVQHTSWRWTFYITSILDGFLVLIGVFFLPETYAPVILEKIERKRRHELVTDHNIIPAIAPQKNIYAAMREKLGNRVTRSFRLLLTSPILQVMSLYMGFVYGLMYLAITSFASVWESEFGESISVAPLNYVSLGIGFVLASQFFTPLQDKVFQKLKQKNNGITRPEFRVPLMIPGAVLLPIGLLWYGWSLQAHAPWIVPNIGAAIFGAGIIMSLQCINLYLVDTFTIYAASAVSGATVIRSLAGFGFPLFAQKMYDSLGQGWGNSVLAFVGICLGWPIPILLWYFGEALRKRSHFSG